MSPICSPCPGIRKAVLCVSLLFGLCSCLRQYVLINDVRSWSDAQTYCRENHNDLATVDNMEDLGQLIAAAGSFAGTVWTGLQDKEMTWQWSSPQGSEQMVYFNRWEFTKPSNPRDQWEMCAVHLDDTWYDRLCDEVHPFACYDGSPPSKSYVFINEPKTWRDAQAYCRQNHTDLASVMSKGEDDAIGTVIPHDIMTSIGLFRPTWAWWSDGSIHTFQHWIQGRPQGRTGDCAASLIDPANDGMFSEYDCGTRFAFMCNDSPKVSPPVKHVHRIRLTVLKSTVDLNDPAVTEAILTQMKKKMRETGITTDFNITWIHHSDTNIFYKKND